MNWNNYLLIFIGVWLILSPWTLGFSSIDILAWNNVLVGIFVIVFAAWNFLSPED